MTFQIGFLLFPGLTQLDLTGPAQVLSRMSDAAVHYVWKTLDPVPSDAGLSLVPTKTFDSCPNLDLVCVPGGLPIVAVMEDADAMAWLRRQGEGARYVTSVCTGSLILGAAGLLRGYRAGCHWAWRDLLPHFGAEPVSERVVVDRDRITGGGVTAGIDFAFRVLEEVRGKREAQAIQLALEYDPKPPQAGGTPDTSPPEVVAFVRGLMRERMADRPKHIERIAMALA
jgi:cyclohexyl-isocyanide hydratase